MATSFHQMERRKLLGKVLACIDVIVFFSTYVSSLPRRALAVRTRRDRGACPQRTRWSLEFADQKHARGGEMTRKALPVSTLYQRKNGERKHKKITYDQRPYSLVNSIQSCSSRQKRSTKVNQRKNGIDKHFFSLNLSCKHSLPGASPPRLANSPRNGRHLGRSCPLGASLAKESMARRGARSNGERANLLPGPGCIYLND